MGGNEEVEEGLDEDTELGEDDIVSLTDDEGNTVDFAILLVVELEGTEYAALTPVDQLEDYDSEEQDIYLFVYEEVEEEEGVLQTFSPIEDEALFEAVRDFCAQQMAVMDDGDDA